MGCAGSSLPLRRQARRRQRAREAGEERAAAERLLREGLGHGCRELLEELPRSEGSSPPRSRRWSVSSEQDFDLRRPSFSKKPLRESGDEGPARRSVGLACHKGQKQSAHPNQDSALVLTVEGDYSIYGVFDGHGHNGHWVSDFVKEHLPRLIVRDGRFRTAEMADMLRDCFGRVQELLAAATTLHKVNARLSGTTATVVVHDHETQKLTVAHAGDSGACLGRRRRSWRASPPLEAKLLTQDHRPDLEDERQRIEGAGGRVLADGHGNHRVYAKNQPYPALNMSRALGDLAGHSEAGISCEPEVTEIQLGPEDRVLLLCSDGVWEFMAPDQAVEAVAGYGPEEAALAAERLAREAWNCWIQEEGGAVVDDITALVVYLDAGAAPGERPAAGAEEAQPGEQPMSALACFEGAGLSHLRPAHSLFFGRMGLARGGC